MIKKRLGELLQERGKLDEHDLNVVLAEQKLSAQPLGELLLRKGLVGKDDLVTALQETGRFSYLDPRSATPDPQLLACVTRDVAMRYSALPVYRQGKRIVAVLAEPQDLQALHELSFLCGAEVSPRLGFRSEIEQAIDKWYGTGEAGVEPESPVLQFIEQADHTDVQFASVSSSERAQAVMDEIQAELRNEKTPAVRLVSAILAASAQKGASDIHVEPQPLGALVRIRVDGVMRELTQVPADLAMSLVSRIKILSDMDIAERRQPQDGRFLAQIGSHKLDLRVSTLPTHYGEKVVMRLLDPASAQSSFLRFAPTS